MPKKKTNLGGLNILLGISGGVAAYKAVDLASKLRGCGANVKTVMTANACQLVQPKSFEAVTASPVFTSLWGPSEGYKIDHINLADWADIVIVAPATANIIGKIANGICDDLLSTVLCACWAKPRLLAAAMNNNMWNNPAVQRNVKLAQEMGFELTGPETGRLACGEEGIGRMSEPQDILEAITKMASKIKRKKR
ncbi:MAG: phosphopantothenoylcysteine decarboxylase [Planctomycetota bacterium]|nr:MAG: phosphopantothenoylcysteine decarboxylase [Planctomycetota bacterium]